MTGPRGESCDVTVCLRGDCDEIFLGRNADKDCSSTKTLAGIAKAGPVGGARPYGGSGGDDDIINEDDDANDGESPH